jgi:hypothetical protein
MQTHVPKCHCVHVREGGCSGGRCVHADGQRPLWQQLGSTMLQAFDLNYKFEM